LVTEPSTFSVVFSVSFTTVPSSFTSTLRSSSTVSQPLIASGEPTRARAISALMANARMGSPFKRGAAGVDASA
jgi:hypothetical protein